MTFDNFFPDFLEPKCPNTLKSKNIPGGGGEGGGRIS